PVRRLGPCPGRKTNRGGQTGTDKPGTDGQTGGQTGRSPFFAVTRQRRRRLGWDLVRTSSAVLPFAEAAAAKWNVPEPRRIRRSRAAGRCGYIGVTLSARLAIPWPQDARAILPWSSVFAIAPLPAGSPGYRFGS